MMKYGMMSDNKSAKEHQYIVVFHSERANERKIYTQTAAEQVTERIINMIIAGELKPGEKLPNEADLAGYLGVGRNTIREGIKTLTAYGILESRRKEGTTVCDGYSPKLLDPLIYGMILNDQSNQDLIQLRRILENGVMLLAIENATDDDIEAVRKQLDEQKAYVAEDKIDPAMMTDLDLEFHELIARCTHNELLIYLFRMFNLLMRSSRLDNHRELVLQDREEYTISAHQKLCDVLSSRDSKMAEEAVAYSQVSWIGKVSSAD